jgi:2-C-methyl-D-erythritol 4-phosphate cytidylyltransferase
LKRIHAILLAGGDGNRFGADLPKQFVRLAGEQILARSLRTIAAAGVDRIVVVANPGWLAETEEVVAAQAAGIPTSIVVGGATRNESTRNGLRALDADDADVIVVHDAVRPLADPALFERVVAAVRAGADGAVPALPVADTVKRIDPFTGLVLETLDRPALRAVQTPQAFAAAVLRRAHAGAADATDDAALVEAAGGRVVVVDGDPANLKITGPDDLARAETLLAGRTG